MYEIVVVKFATIRVWIVLLHCPVSSNKPGVTTQIYCHSVDGSNSKALKDRPCDLSARLQVCFRQFLTSKFLSNNPTYECDTPTNEQTYE